jgi:GNAT superfamily N-acetyltransferase
MTLIRATEPHDLDALYEVCLRTGAAGEDASSQFENPRLLGEVYVGPYVTLPSGIGLTPVDEEGPAGYALAAVDTRRFEAECEAAWWPRLRSLHPDPGPDPSTADEEVIASIYRPHRASDHVVARYPAHLHLDLLPRLQGRGVGRLLIDRLLGELAARGLPGVHLDADARNDRAIGFYRHLGFSTLDAGEEVVVMGILLDLGLKTTTPT